MDQHEDLSCEDFNLWLEANDPINQEKGVAALLNDSKIGRFIISLQLYNIFLLIN